MEKPFVLLADDNEATCTLITALLQREFVVDVVHDGAEAVERLKSRQYAVVLIDLLMPTLDGFGVLDFIRANRPHLLTRVLIVTAALSAREMNRLREYNVAAVIAKPFEVDTLYATVRQCAGGADPNFMNGPLLSGGMIFLIGELLRRVH